MSPPDPTPALDASDNPLASDSPRIWEQLIEAAGPGSLLFVIESRMSDALKRRLGPEDIWQETLLCAWRDRRQFEWRGLKSFRAWLLAIIDNRIREAVDAAGAAKRGGGKPPVMLSSLTPLDASGSEAAFPAGSTTPSRVAMFKAQAAAMRAALADLPDDHREVVRLRLFEQYTLKEIAGRLGIGLAAAQHRFRKGSESYLRRLRAELASRSQTLSQKDAPTAGPNSSSDL